MKNAFAFLVLLVILGLVARSMIGLTRLATGSAPMSARTRTILDAVPLVGFSLWAIVLFGRLFLQSSAFTMWPFELAIAVTAWLGWVALIAIAVVVRDLILRITGRTAAVPPGTESPRTAEANADHV